jgi:hypothetical protein
MLFVTSSFTRSWASRRRGGGIPRVFMASLTMETTLGVAGTLRSRCVSSLAGRED